MNTHGDSSTKTLQQQQQLNKDTPDNTTSPVTHSNKEPLGPADHQTKLHTGDNSPHDNLHLLGCSAESTSRDQNSGDLDTHVTMTFSDTQTPANPAPNPAQGNQQSPRSSDTETTLKEAPKKEGLSKRSQYK